MSNTPETEVLRISGNVTVPKELKVELTEGLNQQIKEWENLGIHWSGSIVPQDDDTGMRLYRVEDVEGYKKSINVYIEVIQRMQEERAENDKLTLSLYEELSKEREKLKSCQKWNKFKDGQIDANANTIITYIDKIQALEKRLELAENTRWRTFIKWWKELWK